MARPEATCSVPQYDLVALLSALRTCDVCGQDLHPLCSPYEECALCGSLTCLTCAEQNHSDFTCLFCASLPLAFAATA
jgi:hypothetical protein